METDNRALELLRNDPMYSDMGDHDWELFLLHAERLGLDPVTRQIMVNKRWNKDQRCYSYAPLVTIDGFRCVASRTGEYEGQTPTMWCGPDGVWTDVWLAKEPPRAAKVGVYRKNFREPLYAVALWEAYAQTTKAGGLNRTWANMGPLMLAKCCEALALRRAFPSHLSGVYTSDEMAQASNPEPRAEEPAEGRTKALAARLAQKSARLAQDEPSETRADEEPVITETAIGLDDVLAGFDVAENAEQLIRVAESARGLTGEDREIAVRAYKAKVKELDGRAGS